MFFKLLVQVLVELILLLLKPYKDDNDTIMSELFKKQRKELFKNKTNVLVDNFYEGISSQSKNKVIKEGAISKCSIFNEMKEMN